ncbi:MAG: hypothetical protein FWF43_00325 [Propionibacteriaceae bacterium]|nr:hypothetical protein [Propionibacteriaceae bacterium]
MTRMLLTAERVATVDDIVYHYHSRPGDTSITSLQGHVDFFTDYLREEIQCAELCMGTPDRGIKKSYALTVLRRDLPKHLQSLLATYDALDPATSGALQNDLSLFLSLVADAPMARPAAACAFAVETASNGQWSTCQRIIADLWNQEPAEPSVYASGLCSCQDSPHLHPWVYTHIFTEKVLRRLATLPSESLATEVRDHAQVYQLCLQNYSSSLDLDDGEKRVLAEIRKVGTSSEPA